MEVQSDHSCFYPQASNLNNSTLLSRLLPLTFIENKTLLAFMKSIPKILTSSLNYLDTLASMGLPFISTGTFDGVPLFTLQSLVIRLSVSWEM